VSRSLIRSQTFVRAAKRLIKKRPQAIDQLRIALTLLEENAFHPSLKTHKLKGEFEGSWACSVGYDIRLIFEFVRHDEQEAVLLQTVGTHDEVY
jgi:mRNA-degrading endonuclease YafQ of YafQ-DinJ toxin-antitoxin module